MTAIELRPEGSLRSETLFAAYRDRILAYCLRRLRSRTEAEDAVQTTFLYAHRALQRGVVPRSEEAWLFTIAKNVCRWQQRTASRRVALSERDTDAVADEHDSGELEELRHDLGEALAAIPERQRQAILLREWRGLSCPEIAEALELSEPATHALLSRARRALAGSLAAAGRRPVLGLDLGSLLLHLRSVFAGSGAKAAAAAVAVTSVGVGGYTIEQAIMSQTPPEARRAVTAAPSAPVTRVPEAARGISLTPTPPARRPVAPRRAPVPKAVARVRRGGTAVAASPAPAPPAAEPARTPPPRAKTLSPAPPAKPEPKPTTTEPEPAPAPEPEPTRVDELLPLELPQVDEPVPVPVDLPPLPAPELPPVPTVPDVGSVLPSVPVPEDPLPDLLP